MGTRLNSIAIGLTWGVALLAPQPGGAADKAPPDKVLAAVQLDPSTFTFTPQVVYGRKYGMALTMDVFTPKKNAKGVAVIVLISGGWFSEREAFAQYYCLDVMEPLSRGYTVFTVCHGANPKFTIPEILLDIHRAVRFIRFHAKDYAIDPDRIGITGGSAGGHLSLMLGTAGDAGDIQAKDPIDRVSSRVQAVACFCPPTDFLNYGAKDQYAFAPDGPLAALGAVMDVREQDPKTTLYERVTDKKKVMDLARKLSPITHITASAAPTLIIHGDADTIVPIQQAEEFVARLKEKKVPAQLVVIRGGGHGNWPDRHKDLTTVTDWFDKYLAKK